MAVTSRRAQAVVKEYQCREEHPVACWEAYSLQACGSGNLVSYAQRETLIADARVSHGLGREYVSSCPAARFGKCQWKAALEGRTLGQRDGWTQSWRNGRWAGGTDAELEGQTLDWRDFELEGRTLSWRDGHWAGGTLS